ncbi:DUF262 domain-containing HNH endonuclease family protein [Ruminococcus flavefaciens]|uniref:DUF262 domain-containing protein n=1 Tax=Ruminococcus flavefaciens TaxID=1265 RepID=UPI0026F021BB|nr:DUF262 domain-containing HNH endonuclease family protein [Ruminococcus flavefaciens]
MSSIKGGEYPLSKIFSSEFNYNIPSYQRPYSWTIQEAGILFDDLYDFYKNEDKEENYFLGSIVLIKQDDYPKSDVIDGQQRLTTLTILLAVIAHSLSDSDDRDEFKNYINEKGIKSQGIKPKPRLKIRERDNNFFKSYIQDLKIDELVALKPEAQDTEAKANIVRNAEILQKKIKETFSNEDDIFDFGSFLVQRCYLVVVSTPSQQSAFRIFSVMNSRGMNLLATDIIKSDVIGKINEDNRDDYTEKWEEIETQLGRDDFNDLFGHIRMIKMKSKAKKSLQEEFYKYVLTDINNDTAIEFIDKVLEPYSDAYNIIKKAVYTSTENAEKVNNILKWLNRIDNSDWLPPAMVFYCKHKTESDKLLTFFEKLERLASYMRMTSFDINHRIERYARLISDLQDENDDSIYGESIELSVSEQNAFISELNSDIYKMTGAKRNYLILRLDAFMSDGAASYKSNVLSIEHVLPQTVSPGSEWDKTWADVDDRSYWLNKIGNLIPLTKRHNSKAQNYDFKTKKEKYFKNTDAGVTSYALATDVLNYDEWTPDIVKARQKKLIDAYKKGWDLIETAVESVIHNAAVQVIKTISENDIRARILRIPAKIKDRIPESMTSYTVTFNGETVKELTIAKERDYFAKVTDLYKKYGLIDADGSFIPKQITWSMDEDGALSATINSPASPQNAQDN